jgi:hypothetical protein
MLIEKYSSEVPLNPDYICCPTEWSETYKLRRKTCCLALDIHKKIMENDGVFASKVL